MLLLRQFLRLMGYGEGGGQSPTCLLLYFHDILPPVMNLHGQRARKYLPNLLERYPYNARLLFIPLNEIYVNIFFFPKQSYFNMSYFITMSHSPLAIRDMRLSEQLSLIFCDVTGRKMH